MITHNSSLMHTDSRIDAYISAAADFAKPILQHLRKLVHKAHPDIQETMKWSFPHFEYKGLLCSMAAFKNHCSFGFWKASLINDPDELLSVTERTAMGSFGKITSLKDLPSDKILIDYLKQAVKLNEEGVKTTAKTAKKEGKRSFEVPADLTSWLAKNKKAKATFDAFSPSHRYEYVEWIEEAKTEATREKRLTTAIEWLQEGKSRHWKYKKEK
jgi:uncharacterized protein YdeI (YjbR/CyaY-like superfamily)